MKIVLLPGLDGTGILFKKLIECLPRHLEVDVVSYENIEGLSYINQAKEIASKYQGEEIFIVGESYSGSVAYELCQLLNSNLKGIVFLASFISRPTLLSVWTSFIPVGLLAPNFLTRALLYFFGFNGSGGKNRVTAVFHSLKIANKAKLRSRLRNISNLRNPGFDIACPVIYVRPSKDWFVARKSVNILASKCSFFKEVSVEGGHFIAQANPVACAKVINSAVTKLS